MGISLRDIIFKIGGGFPTGMFKVVRPVDLPAVSFLRSSSIFRSSLTNSPRRVP